MHTWSKVNFAGLMYKYFHLLGSEPVKHVLLQQRSSGKQYLYAKCASRKAGLRPAHAPMAAYLPEPSTRAILFAPIRAAIMDALGQLQTILNAFELTAPKTLILKPERLSLLAAAIDALGGAPAART